MTSSPLVFRCLLPLILLLAGCSKAESDRFFEGIAEIILLAMALMALMACIGVVLLALQIVVVVLNLVRPSVGSMVTGYVFAGLHACSILGSVAMMVASTVGVDAEAAAGTETIINGMVGLVMSAGLGALLGGSSRYAQLKLAPKPPPFP
ncbi:MAG: hypothetical protein V4850_21720 [Myxococcota bacterium]